jgi:hypothetical protein
MFPLVQWDKYLAVCKRRPVSNLAVCKRRPVSDLAIITAVLLFSLLILSRLRSTRFKL